MAISIKQSVLKQIYEHVESTYPEEGAGFLFGEDDGDTRQVDAIMKIINARENGARRNRYLITPKDMLQAENEADRQGLHVVGIFHSHPEHPNRPSDFDREWALPWYSYLITSVNKGKASESRSWRLADDRSKFEEEEIIVQ